MDDLVESQRISDSIFKLNNQNNKDFFVMHDHGVRRNSKEMKKVAK